MKEKSDFVSKTVTVVGGVFLLFALVFVSYDTFFGSEKRFIKSWKQDYQTLLGSGKLHEGFKDVKKVEFISGSKKLESVSKTSELKFVTNPNGKFELQVFLDEIEGGGVVVQYDLVDITSRNTVQEIGRTFPHHL